jgi:hypothetical protein
MPYLTLSSLVPCNSTGSLGRPSSAVFCYGGWTSSAEGGTAAALPGRHSLDEGGRLQPALSEVEGSSPFWYNRILVDHVVGMIGFLGLSQSLNTQILFPVDVHHL